MPRKTYKALWLAVLLAPAGANAAAIPESARPPSSKEIVVEILDLDKAIAEVSRDTSAVADLYNTVKEAYLRQGKRDKAISLLATYERNRGADLSLLSSLAYLYEQAGALDRAMKVQEKVVGLDPENLWANNKLLLAEFCLRSGDYDKARSLAKSLNDREPGNRSYLRLLSRAQQAANDWKAVETTKKVIQLDPQAGDYQRLAELYVKEEKYDEAVAALEEGSKKLPNEAIPLGIVIADIYIRSGDKDKAIRVLNDLVLRTNNSDLKNNMKVMVENLRKSAAATPLAAPAPAQAVP